MIEEPSAVIHHSDTEPTSATIIGGGIGGLTMANALLRVGIPFELYEQANGLTEVGAGIGLSRGVLELLDLLDLGDEVRSRGRPIRHIYLADKQLQIRRKLPANYEGVCIHRAVLIDILKGRLPQDRIHLSSRVTAVRSEPGRAEVDFEDGRTISTACLIAADGVNSVTRSSLFPDIQIRYIDQTIWRGITSGVDVPEWFTDSYLEVWDEGLRFLTVPIGEGIFWLAVKPAPPGEKDDPETVLDELLDLFKNYHPTLQGLIRHTDGLIRNDMGDLGPPNRPWHHNRVVFIGDSIHATTPNLAQGGCQAIEDALCLAQCLCNAASHPERAFAEYQRLRQKKVSFVVNTSWRFGRGAHSRNPLVYHLARAALEWTPGPLLARQERFLSDVEYLKGRPLIVSPESRKPV